MVKWDYDIKVVGIPDDRVDEILDKLEAIITAEGLGIQIGIGYESEE